MSSFQMLTIDFDVSIGVPVHRQDSPFTAVDLPSSPRSNVYCWTSEVFDLLSFISQKRQVPQEEKKGKSFQESCSYYDEDAGETFESL